jgi:hypothetical protein
MEPTQSQHCPCWDYFRASSNAAHGAVANFTSRASVKFYATGLRTVFNRRQSAVCVAQLVSDSFSETCRVRDGMHSFACKLKTT